MFSRALRSSGSVQDSAKPETGLAVSLKIDPSFPPPLRLRQLEDVLCLCSPPSTSLPQAISRGTADRYLLIGEMERNFVLCSINPYVLSFRFVPAVDALSYASSSTPPYPDTYPPALPYTHG